MEGTMGMVTIMVDIIPSVLVAAHMLLTVSGDSVSVTVGTRRDMADVTGLANMADLITLILLLSVWTAPCVRGWT